MPTHAFLVDGVVPTSQLDAGFGTYTPTLVNSSNLDASTAYQCQYLRFGSMVLVSGKFDANPVIAVLTKLGISLPTASNFGAAEDCAGVAFAPEISGQGAAILGDTVNNRAEVQWTALDLTNQSMYFTFMYQVIA